MSDAALTLAGDRVRVILDILFLSPSLLGEMRMADSTMVSVAANIPDVRAYEAREAACSKYFIGDPTPEKLQEPEDQEGPKKVGSKFVKIQ